MIHPEYDRVLVSVGGKNAPRVLAVRAAQRLLTSTGAAYDTHHSIARYDAQLDAHVAENGRAGKYAGSCIADLIYFDVDRGRNGLGIALRDALTLAVHLHDQYGVREDQLRYFFSGAKGYHLALPLALCGAAVQPSPLLPAVLKRMALAISEGAGVEIDAGIFRRLGMIRAPGTQHPTSQRWKTELSWSEFSTLTSDAIVQLATGPDPRPFRWRPHDLEPHDALVDLYARCARAAAEWDAQPRPEPVRRDRSAPLDTDAVVQLVAPHYTDGHRHWVATYLSGYLARQGVPLADAERVISGIAQGDDDGGEKSLDRCRASYSTLAEGMDVRGYYGLKDELPDDVLAELATLVEPAPATTMEFPAIEFTDTGNAARLAAIHAGRIRFVPKWNAWTVWDERAGVWVRDDRGVLMGERAKDVGRQLLAEAAATSDDTRREKLAKWGTQAFSAARIHSMIELARGIDGVPISPDAFDTDPWLLGVQNGVVDLRTGTLRPARPADLMMMQAPVDFDPAAAASRWRRALEEWHPDAAVRSYVARLVGAALVGRQRDHVFVLHYGLGANGKSTFTKSLFQVLGPYCTTPHMSLLVQTKHPEHATVRASLYRVRLAVASETERRVKLAEASVKDLTGDERIRCRRLYENEWSFDPTHSLWLATNHLPEIAGRDTGIWRRIKVLPWVSTFQRDQAEDLPVVLAGEAAGILAWAVEGCLAWQREGLHEPEAVIRATLAYRSSEDALSRFAADTGLVFAAGRDVTAQTLNDTWDEWAATEGVRVSRREFTDWLRENGADRRQRRRSSDNCREWYWAGVCFTLSQTDSEDPVSPVSPALPVTFPSSTLSREVPEKLVTVVTDGVGEPAATLANVEDL